MDSQQAEITAAKRTVVGKHVSKLRSEGWVPGVIYGHGFEAMSLQFKERGLHQLLSHVGGSQLVAITVEGQAKPEMALVRDVQRDVIKGNVLHVDFYRVLMTERLRAQVPLALTGVPPAVESGLGILIQGVDSLEIECLPGDLIDAIEVDLSDLAEVGQSIHVSDLAIPSVIDVITDLEELVARVVPLGAEEVIEEEEVLEIGEVEILTEAAEGEGEGEVEEEAE